MGEDAAQKVTGEKTFLSLPPIIAGVFQRGKRTAVFFQCRRMAGPDEEEGEDHPCKNGSAQVFRDHVSRSIAISNGHPQFYGRQGSKISSQSFDASNVGGTKR